MKTLFKRLIQLLATLAAIVVFIVGFGLWASYERKNYNDVMKSRVNP